MSKFQQTAEALRLAGISFHTYYPGGHKGPKFEHWAIAIEPNLTNYQLRVVLELGGHHGPGKTGDLIILGSEDVDAS